VKHGPSANLELSTAKSLSFDNGYRPFYDHDAINRTRCDWHMSWSKLRGPQTTFKD
jgi:hypothetical protein